MFNYGQIESTITQELLELIRKNIVLSLQQPGEWFETPVPAVVCNDGFSMSCQANVTAYSSPRKNGILNYTEVEIGFPSLKEELLSGSSADSSDDDNQVWGYVDINIVQEIVEKHGGLDVAATFKEYPEIVTKWLAIHESQVISATLSEVKKLNIPTITTKKSNKKIKNAMSRITQSKMDKLRDNKKPPSKTNKL